jgi:hypothetical protein
MHPSVDRQFTHGFDHPLVADLKTGSQIVDSHRLWCICQQLQDSEREAIVSRNCGCGEHRNDFEECSGGLGLDKLESHRTESRSGAVFSGKEPLPLMTTEIKERVHPCIEVSGTAQGVAWPGRSRSIFSNVVDKSNRGAGFPLQTSQESKECGNLAGDVLINRMNTDQRIKDEQRWPVRQQRCFKPVLMIGPVQAEGIDCDYVQI